MGMKTQYNYESSLKCHILYRKTIQVANEKDASHSCKNARFSF